MRMERALELAVHAVFAALAVAIIALSATRLGWLSRAMSFAAFGVEVVIGVVYVVARARPVAAGTAARKADLALGLSDRLGSAVAFLEEVTLTELQAAAIRDAGRSAAAVDASRVVALRLPTSSRALPLAVLVLVGVAWLGVPAPVSKKIPPLANKSRLVVEPDALAAEYEAVRKLAHDANGKDPALSELAQKLEALLEQVDKQQLSRSEAFAQLAALEQKLDHDGNLPRPSEQLKAVQKALASSAQTQQLAAALAKDDLSAAKAELDKLAAAAEQRAKEEKTSAKDNAAQEELSRALDRASKALDDAQKKADAERDKKMEALQEEQRQLQKQRQEHPEDQDTERRLKRNKRELERLEHEKKQQAEQKRQLERLSQDMQQAAEELRKKMSPEAMRKMSEELGKMEEEIKKLGSNGRAQMQIGELKEVLRRAGRVEAGDGPSGKNGQGKNGQSQQAGGDDKAHGNKGKGDREERLQEFDDRAGGKPNALLLGGDNPGEGAMLLPLPAGSQPGGGDQPNGDKPGGKGGDDPSRPGDGIGDQHDPNVQGEATHLKTNQKTIHASGKAGAGPSRSQTILGASERGFANRHYREAYNDYVSAVEEVISQERLPPGYRYYVKRYFQLIRPRE